MAGSTECKACSASLGDGPLSVAKLTKPAKPSRAVVSDDVPLIFVNATSASNEPSAPSAESIAAAETAPGREPAFNPEAVNVGALYPAPPPGSTSEGTPEEKPQNPTKEGTKEDTADPVEKQVAQAQRFGPGMAVQACARYPALCYWLYGSSTVSAASTAVWWHTMASTWLNWLSGSLAQLCAALFVAAGICYLLSTQDDEGITYFVEGFFNLCYKVVEFADYAVFKPVGQCFKKMHKKMKHFGASKKATRQDKEKALRDARGVLSRPEDVADSSSESAVNPSSDSPTNPPSYSRINAGGAETGQDNGQQEVGNVPIPTQPDPQRAVGPKPAKQPRSWCNWIAWKIFWILMLVGVVGFWNPITTSATPVFNATQQTFFTAAERVMTSTQNFTATAYDAMPADNKEWLEGKRTAAADTAKDWSQKWYEGFEDLLKQLNLKPEDVSKIGESMPTVKDSQLFTGVGEAYEKVCTFMAAKAQIIVVVMLLVMIFLEIVTGLFWLVTWPFRMVFGKSGKPVVPNDESDGNVVHKQDWRLLRAVRQGAKTVDGTFSWFNRWQSRILFGGFLLLVFLIFTPIVCAWVQQYWASLVCKFTNWSSGCDVNSPPAGPAGQAHQHAECTAFGQHAYHGCPASTYAQPTAACSNCQESNSNKPCDWNEGFASFFACAARDHPQDYSWAEQFGEFAAFVDTGTGMLRNAAGTIVSAPCSLMQILVPAADANADANATTK